MCQNTQEKIGVQYEKLSQEELIFALQLAAAREESIRPKKVTIPSAEIERIREVLGCLVHTSKITIFLIFWYLQNLALFGWI